MSNVNVGGVEGSLILNLREWNAPAREALQTIKEITRSIDVTTALANRSAKSNLGEAGKAFDGLGGSARAMAQQISQSVTGLDSRLRDASGRFKGFGQDAKSGLAVAGAGTASFSRDFGLNMLNVRETLRDVGGMLQSWGASMRSGLAATGRAFVGFDQQMRDVDSIAKLSEEELANLSKTVKDLGGEMKLTQGPQALGSALKDITGAGFEAKDALDVLKAAAKGADAGGTDAKTFAGGITPLIRAYDLKGSDAFVVTDQLFKAMDQGKLEAAELARGIGQVAPVASQAGVRMQELMGSLASMSLNGKSASENFTAYRAAMLHILAPAEDAKKLLAAYGVEAGETAIRTKGLLGVIQDLYAKTGGNQEVIKKVLDDEGLQAAAALMRGDRGAGTQQMITAQYSAEGSTDDAFERRAKGLQFQLEQLGAAWERLKIGLGTGLEPILGPSIAAINRVAQSLLRLPDSTKAALGGLAALTAALTSATGAMILMAPTAIQISTWAGGFSGVSKLAATGAALVTQGLASLSAGLSAIAAPAAIVVAITGALALAWKNDWGGIREFTSELLGDLKELTHSAMEAIRTNLGPVASEIAANFREGWPDVRDFFLWIGKSVFEVVIPVLRNLWQVVKDVTGLMSSAFKTAWGTISPIFKFFEKSVQDATEIFVRAISGDWKGALNVWVESFRQVGPRIQAAIEEIGQNAIKGLMEIGPKISEAFQRSFTFENPWKYNDESGWNAKNGLGITKAFRDAQNSLSEFTDVGSQKLQGLFDTLLKVEGAAKKVSSASQMGGGTKGYTPPPETPDLSSHRTRKAKVVSTEDLAAARVVSEANRRTGTSFRAGDVEQCANFVRAVYAASGVKVGASARPIDFALTAGQGQGPGYANSFFGKDVGKLVSSIQELKPGDAVGFRNTYGDYKPGTITHVGVYTGAGNFIHRPTANAPVRQDSLSGRWGELFAAGMRPTALIKGGAGMMGGTNYDDLLKAHEKVQEFLGKTNTVYENQRREISKTYAEALNGAKSMGASKEVINQLGVEQRRRIAEVNEAERREAAKTANEVSITRLEAEGKMGEAARVRIAQTANEERSRLEDLLKSYPQMKNSISEAMAAVTANEQRQLASVKVQDAGRQMGASQDISAWQANDVGINALMSKFPQFRAEIESAYAAIGRYIQEPAEHNRKAFEEAQGFITQTSAVAQAEWQKKMEAIDWERQMGMLTDQETLARKEALLQQWVGGESQKREILLSMTEQYREHYQQQIEQQGEYSLQTLEQLVSGLQQMQTLTLAQQAQLAAANSILMQQRAADQQQWRQILQQSGASFESFLGQVATGQQNSARRSLNFGNRPPDKLSKS